MTTTVSRCLEEQKSLVQSRMTAHQHLRLILIGVLAMSWNMSQAAEDDVTILKAPSDASATVTPAATGPDGASVVHKSLHKKKTRTASAADKPKDSTTNKVTDNVFAAAKGAPVPSTTTMVAKARPGLPKMLPAPKSNATISQPPIIAKTGAPDPLAAGLSSTGTMGPTVETGLPVARHFSADPKIKALAPIPNSATVSSVQDSRLKKAPTGTSSYRTVEAGIVPAFTRSATAAGTGLYSSSTTINNFTFTNFEKRTRTYPWKSNIITTIFWIGEGDTPISRTTNEASAWDEEWRSSNGGADSPEDRNGYASGRHASTINPFYFALPFNDLAFPDKARRWMPDGWYKTPRSGQKAVSACKDRWIEIKNQQGEPCYAQWEDVGPLRYDHAEYVFGPERPDTYSRAGLDVSPAVAQYLHLDGKNNITSWRFVDDGDVKPGMWLKYDEQAVIFQAFKELKNTKPLPIQRNAAPIEDAPTIDSNQRKIKADRG